MNHLEIIGLLLKAASKTPQDNIKVSTRSTVAAAAASNKEQQQNGWESLLAVGRPTSSPVGYDGHPSTNLSRNSDR